MEIFNLDTHFPGSQNRSNIAILYGALGSKEFAQFHHVLSKKAEEGVIDYMIRHFIKVIFYCR